MVRDAKKRSLKTQDTEGGGTFKKEAKAKKKEEKQAEPSEIRKYKAVLVLIFFRGS